jgi:hypothetical protein
LFNHDIVVTVVIIINVAPKNLIGIMEDLIGSARFPAVLGVQVPADLICPPFCTNFPEVFLMPIGSDIRIVGETLLATDPAITAEDLAHALNEALDTFLPERFRCMRVRAFSAVAPVQNF